MKKHKNIRTTLDSLEFAASCFTALGTQVLTLKEEGGTALPESDSLLSLGQKIFQAVATGSLDSSKQPGPPTPREEGGGVSAVLSVSIPIFSRL